MVARRLRRRLREPQKNPKGRERRPEPHRNLFEITFDGQSSIIGASKGRPGPLGSAMPGSVRIRHGAARVTRGSSRIGDRESLDDPRARRAALVAEGRPSCPTSVIDCPGRSRRACRNGYRESVVWADIDVRRARPTNPIRRAPRRRLARRPGERPEATRSRNTRLHRARGRHVYVSGKDDGAGSSIYLAVSTTPAHLRPPIPWRQPAGSAELNRRSPCAAPRLVVWQEFITRRR